jgi:DNA mismatch repair protein MutL
MATHPPAMVAEHTQMKILDLPPTRSFRYPSIPLAETAKPEHWTIDKDMSLDSTAIPAPASGTHASGDDTEGALSSPWSYCRVLGQIGDLYVVLETDDGYVMMDPHAAHERVLFDRFMSDFLKGKVESQSLLIPETVDLMPADAERVRKHLDLFQQMGFGVSDFGGDSFVIDAMPSYFSGASSRSMLIDISEGFEKGGRHAGRERWREHAIATAACRAAVKARDRLTMEEIEGLVNDLARTRMPYTCPHGRPTLIFTSYRELNRKFGRE